MKNLKKITLSGLVACLVIGFSAFKDASRSINDYYVQTTPGTYELVLNANYDDSCEPLDSDVCSFQQTTNENLPTPITRQYIIDNPTKFSVENAEGLYTGTVN